MIAHPICSFFGEAINLVVIEAIWKKPRIFREMKFKSG